MLEKEERSSKGREHVGLLQGKIGHSNSNKKHQEREKDANA